MSDDNQYGYADDVELSSYRKLSGWMDRAVNWLFVAVPIIGTFFVMDVPFYLDWDISRERYYGMMFAFIMASTFVLVPMTKKSKKEGVPWYDAICALLSLIIGFYLFMYYDKLLLNQNTLGATRITLATIGIILVLEATRRTAGLILTVFGLLFILLPHLSLIFPDLPIAYFPLDQQVNYLFLDTNAILGMIFGTIVSVILGYLLFGNLIFCVGGGAFITDIAIALFGKNRGGPGKIAVIASALFSTISGVAVANVATTGTITIPLMKKIGYKSHVAAAIEATASSGGQITPPIMGATAFVMAEMLGVPYQKVAIAAAIPAFLYFLVIFFQVDFEAAKEGMKGMPKDQLPKVSEVMKKSYLFFFPFTVLMVALFVLYLSPEKSAFVAVLSILAVGWFGPRETRLKLKWVALGLRQTTGSMMIITPMALLAGIVVGTISYTGMGFLLSLNITNLAGHSLWLLLPMVAVVCLILGMGMPTLCAYIILAVLVVPAMIQLGVTPMAAHMFIQYFAAASMITPPVCMAAYAAAAIANANPMTTGIVATRFAFMKFVIPFMFIVSPALLFDGTAWEIIFVTVTASIGSYAVAAGLTGFIFGRIGTGVRAILLIAGLGLIFPGYSKIMVLSYLINAACAAVSFLIVFYDWRKSKNAEKGLANLGRAIS